MARHLFRPELLKQKTLALHPRYRDAQIRLGEEDRTLLKRVNGQATVATLCTLTEIPESAIIRIVLRLVARGKLVFADELPFYDEQELPWLAMKRVEGKVAPRELKLDETDEALLAAFDGETRVKDLAKPEGLDRERYLVNVLRLLHAGLAEPVRGLEVARAARRRADPASAEVEARSPAKAGVTPAGPTPVKPGTEMGTEVAAPHHEPQKEEGRRPKRGIDLDRRAAVVLGALAAGGAVLFAVNRIVDALTVRINEPGLTVDGLANVINLVEIRTGSGRQWTGVVTSEFRARPREERLPAVQELVRRVRAGGSKKITLQDSDGKVLAQFEGGVLTVMDRR